VNVKFKEKDGTEMKLTRDQVRHVAELAKLKLTDAEIDLFQEQLSAILDYAVRLDDLDTSTIPPTAAVLPLKNVMRSDVPKPSFPRDVMLDNAPHTEDGFVKVKVVLDID
jgi:aspartyl-tRNA(Asn)/glutamyl-tRNA(Gln) amidotransferase subunit C